MYKWTVIIKNVSGEFGALRHYELKKDAIQDLTYHVGLGYQVTMMAYSVYINGSRGN